MEAEPETVNAENNEEVKVEAEPEAELEAIDAEDIEEIEAEPEDNEESEEDELAGLSTEKPIEFKLTLPPNLDVAEPNTDSMHVRIAEVVPEAKLFVQEAQAIEMIMPLLVNRAVECPQMDPEQTCCEMTYDEPPLTPLDILLSAIDRLTITNLPTKKVTAMNNYSARPAECSYLNSYRRYEEDRWNSKKLSHKIHKE